MNFAVTQANNISTKILFNGEVIQEFENDEIKITFGKFFKSTCKLRFKNNLESNFKPKIRMIFRDNWGNEFKDKKNLPVVNAGKTLDFDIEMKNYNLIGRKNTRAWLQIWIEDKEKVLSEKYFCVQFIFTDYLIEDSEFYEKYSR